MRLIKRTAKGTEAIFWFPYDTRLLLYMYALVRRKRVARQCWSTLWTLKWKGTRNTSSKGYLDNAFVAFVRLRLGFTVFFVFSFKFFQWLKMVFFDHMAKQLSEYRKELSQIRNYYVTWNLCLWYYIINNIIIYTSPINSRSYYIR